jgi:hypothetical protein
MAPGTTAIRSGTWWRVKPGGGDAAAHAVAARQEPIAAMRVRAPPLVERVPLGRVGQEPVHRVEVGAEHAELAGFFGPVRCFSVEDLAGTLLRLWRGPRGRRLERLEETVVERSGT